MDPKLLEQRAQLVKAEYNTRTDAFPGSRAWLRHNAAEQALAAFDAEQAELAAQIEAGRRAAQEQAGKEALARELETTVEELAAMQAKPAPALNMFSSSFEGCESAEEYAKTEARTAEIVAARETEQEGAFAAEWGFAPSEAAPVCTPRLFAPAGLPLCWVASDETGALWLFDAIAGGWITHRRPYRGHRTALTEAPRYNAFGTGWPHVKG